MNSIQWASFAFASGLWIGYYISKFLDWFEAKYEKKISEEYEEYIKNNKDGECGMKYRNKAVEIEAFQLGIDCTPDWFAKKTTSGEIRLMLNYAGDIRCASIQTLEGIMIADFGDFVIKEGKGEIYPCKPDIFYDTYEKSEEME